MTKLKLTAILLTVMGIFVSSNIYTFIPIYSNIASSLHVSEKQAVTAGSLFTFCYAAGLLLFGPISDFIGRKNIIVWGMLCSAISTLLVGLSNEIHLLYLTRSIQGITLASFAPVAFAYSFDLFQEKQRTLLLAFINSGFLAAGILGQIASSFFTQNFDWKTVFYFFSSTYFILFVLGYFLFPTTASVTLTRKNASLSIFLQLFQNKKLIKCYITTFTLLFSFVAFYDSITRSFEGTINELFMIRIVGLSGAALSLFTGNIIKHWKLTGTLYLGNSLAIISIITILLLPNGLMFSSILFVSSIALLLPSVITQIGLLGGQHRAKAISLYSFILLTGASLASPIVSNLSFQKLFILLLCIFTFNFFMIHQKRTKA